MTSLIIEGFDAGPTYYYWRWDGGPASIHVIEQADVDSVQATLAAMLPSRTTIPVDGDEREESTEEMLRRSLQHGDLADPSRELLAFQSLTETVLAPSLVSEIASAAESLPSGERIQLTMSPSARTAQVPWELLVIPGADADRRLIEVADIVYAIPRGIHVGRGRTTDESSYARFADGSARTTYVLDPDTLGVELPVLAPNERLRLAQALEARGESDFVGAKRTSSLVWQPEVSRRALSDALSSEPTPDRLMVVGHVAHTADTPAATSFLLSDPINTYGATDKLGPIRPFSALDMLEGLALREQRTQELARAGLDQVVWPVAEDRVDSQPPGAEIWPAPARVALIACNSGTDLGSPEAFGLVIVFANAGAALVTGTKWTLPTDAGMTEYGAIDPHATPFVDAALHVDLAHRSTTDDDVVKTLCEWQRGQLAAWRSGDRAASPIIWAALSTHVVPHVVMIENDPDAIPMHD